MRARSGLRPRGRGKIILDDVRRIGSQLFTVSVAALLLLAVGCGSRAIRLLSQGDYVHSLLRCTIGKVLLAGREREP